MSDFPQGPDWWKAVNGNWYPPPKTESGEPPDYMDPAEKRAEERAAEERRTARGCWTGIAITLAVIVIWAFYASVDGGDSPEAQRVGAVTACEDFIEDRLRAPGSAKHPRNTGQSSKAGNVFTVNSWVDSDNSFGASLRTTYRCVIRLDGDTWKLQSLVID